MRVRTARTANARRPSPRATRVLAALICLISTLGWPATTIARNPAPAEASASSDVPQAIVGLSDILPTGNGTGAGVGAPLDMPFVPGELIIRFHPDAGGRAHRAIPDGFATAMPGAPAAAQLDQMLQKHGAKAMRRIIKAHEDAHGRPTGSERAHLIQLRKLRGNKSARPLPPLPARTPDLENYFLVEMPGLGEQTDIDAVMAELRSNELVAGVQPNFIHRVQAEPLPDVNTLPNDPYLSSDGATWSEGSFENAFPDLYGLRNIHVLETWDLFDVNGNGRFDEDETAPGEGVVVAVIDTGLDTAHPDIASNVYVNPGEIPGDGIDNDGNGRVDDVSGWDFVQIDAVPEDRHGHGTHVAGTIAAVSDNGQGITGVAPFAKILPIKALNDQGFGTTGALAAAVHYAASMGADISSNSWGGVLVDPLLAFIFENAEASGMLSFAAAGNAARPYVFMPALYPSVVAVGALGPGDVLASFSNWGAGLDLCAPGEKILSLSANDHANLLAERTGRTVGERYLWLNGTSMATPHTSGVGALMMSLHPEESALETKGRLLEAAVSIEQQNPGREDDLGAGRVDALSSALAVRAPLLRPASIRSSGVIAGEVTTIDVEIENQWAPASGVQASLTSDDPGVSILVGEQLYGALSTGESISQRFEIQIAPFVGFGDELALRLTITADDIPAQEHDFSVRGSYFENQDQLADLEPASLAVSGASFGDYDGDGRQDMGVGAAIERIRLYRQQLDGRFEKSEPAGSGFLRYPLFADMNGDGLLDMVAVAPAGTVLSINVGDGRFEALPESSGFVFPANNRLTSITPIDFDADGDLDIVAGVHSVFEDEQEIFRNIVVLRNEGDLTFSDAWAETGISRVLGGHQYLTLDWNGNGLQDLFILHRYAGRVTLYRNLGKGRFEDVTSIAFPKRMLECRDWDDGICDFFETAAAGDHDNDGDTDLFLTVRHNISTDDQSVAMLLENDGRGVYSDVTDGAGHLGAVATFSGTWGTSFFDLENDGDLDILLPIDILLAGTPVRPPEAKVVIWRNEADQTFTHISDIALPPDTPLASLFTVVGDYDGDGAQDILAPAGPFIGEVGGLMHNLAGRDGAWLEVELESVESAPNGMGARVTAVADGRIHTREVHYSPVEAWRVHLGLGDAEVIDVLEIRWASGIVWIRRNVAVDQLLIAHEGSPCAELPGGECPRVEIDVDPGSDENEVNLRSSGLLQVAILGSASLDVTAIDVTRTFFGAGRAAPEHGSGGHVEDVNSDGHADLLSHFRIPETGIEADDEEACLRGQMLDRTPFSGCDAITTKAPNSKGKKK